MALGTIRQVARRIGVQRAVVRGAVDAGLLKPARIKAGGGNRYTRLFDLDDAAARRDQITAAHDRGDLMARGPRTHRHEPRSGGGGPPSPSAGPASPPAARPLGGIFAKAKPVDRERFLRELDEERRLEWRKGGREGDPPPGWRPDHWDE